MKVIKSKSIGYCHGVSETVRLAEYCIKRGTKRHLPVYSIGELIHNPDVVAYFTGKGLKVINKPSEGQPGIALIRAHGITDSLRKEFTDAGFELVDSTCINIQKNIKVIKANAKDGRVIVILGIAGHAETVGLLGVDTLCEANFELVTSVDDAKKLCDRLGVSTPVCVVAQTTFPADLYSDICEVFSEKLSDVVYGNRLCQACIQRKNRALELVGKVDAIVVVGGKNSSNTKNLALEIEKVGKKVFCIEDCRDFTEDDDRILSQFETIGLASGTSTPSGIIDQVAIHLQAL